MIVVRVGRGVGGMWVLLKGPCCVLRIPLLDVIARGLRVSVEMEPGVLVRLLQKWL